MKTIGTCKECKWWKNTNNSHNACINRNLTDDSFKKGDSLLVYEYCEGGEFLPRPDFGCIHWQIKEGITLFDIAIDQENGIPLTAKF